MNGATNPDAIPQLEEMGFPLKSFEGQLVDNFDYHADELGRYRDEFRAAMKKDPRLEKDPQIIIAAALMHVTAMTINTIRNQKEAIPPDRKTTVYHGDSPIDTAAVRIALPDLIKHGADRLTNNQIDAAIAQLQKAKQPNNNR